MVIEVKLFIGPTSVGHPVFSRVSHHIAQFSSVHVITSREFNTFEFFPSDLPFVFVVRVLQTFSNLVLQLSWPLKPQLACSIPNLSSPRTSAAAF
jgi:hypothetical protein